MKKSLFVVLLLILPTISFADAIAKRVYECTYDGGRDASTWQPTGEMAVPPAGAPVCMKLTVDYRCTKVIDASGKELGQGMYCGAEMQPEFPGVKAFEQ